MPRTSGPSVHALKAAIKKHNNKHCVKLTGSKQSLMNKVRDKNIPVDESVKAKRKALSPEQKAKRNAAARARRKKVSQARPKGNIKARARARMQQLTGGRGMNPFSASL